jgi:hypothetical protein
MAKVKSNVVVENIINANRVNSLVASSLPVWITATSYLVNDVVVQGAKIYKCTVAHTAGATFTGDAANWLELSAPTQTVQTLTDAASIAWNSSLGNYAILNYNTVDGTLQNITNPVDGQLYILSVKNTGAQRYLYFDTKYRLNSGYAASGGVSVGNGSTALIITYDGLNDRFIIANSLGLVDVISYGTSNNGTITLGDFAEGKQVNFVSTNPSAGTALVTINTPSTRFFAGLDGRLKTLYLTLVGSTVDTTYSFTSYWKNESFGNFGNVTVPAGQRKTYLFYAYSAEGVNVKLTSEGAIDTVYSYLDYATFKLDTTTVFKVGDKISIDNPFQVLQVLTAGTGFTGITTQTEINQAQGEEYATGTQFASDFTPDMELYGNNYYVAFLTGTTNINVAALQSNGGAVIPSIGQVVNFTVFNTTLVSTTLTFNAAWLNSTGSAGLGTITLAAGEYKRITFEGYYATPTQMRYVETVVNDVLKLWATTTVYKVGDLVKNESRVYRAVTAHTAGTFNTDRANWEVIVPLKTGSPWVASTYYYANDIVEIAAEKRIVKRIASGLSGATFDNTEKALWEIVSSNELKIWSASTYYYAGETVAIAGKFLKRFTSGVSGLVYDGLEILNWEVISYVHGDWLPSTFYYVGETVTNNGVIYKKTSSGVTTTLFNSAEENDWERIGVVSVNPKTISSPTYTVLATDGVLKIDSTANNVDITFPDTLPNGKMFTIQYKQTTNVITLIAGVGTTIVSPYSYTDEPSFPTPGSSGQFGTTQIFKLGTVWNFVG